MIVKTFKHKTEPRILEIHQDENPTDPLEHFDNLGVMICDHPRYNLGHKQASKEEIELDIVNEAYVKLPLYLYDHSGLSMKTGDFNDKWDSGQVGYIYVTKEALEKEYKGSKIPSKKKIEKILKSEVELYDQYLKGEVYGRVEYELQKCNLDELHKKVLDSCWGFYGNIEDSGLFDGYKKKKRDEVEIRDGGLN